MEITINPSLYLSRPNLTVTAAIALGYALRAARQPALGAAADEALDGVTERCEALEAGLKLQQSAAPGDPRPAQRSLATAWSAMVGRVELYAALPAERHPRQAAAAKLYAMLAPDGLEALKSPYRAQWATFKTRMDMAREQGLYAELRAAAGAEFVDEVEAGHAEFGRVLGITEAPEAVEAPNLLDLLRELSQAVTDYVLQVLATVSRKRPETAQTALAALKPIDDAREAAGRRAAPSDGEEPAPAPQPGPVVQPAPQPVAPSPQPVVAQPTPVAKPAAPQRPSLPPSPN